jgi:uncharacterized sporulation protein YeaH/YhbH (DUF444 family)
MEKQTNKEELLKAVADVLDEALAEYEKLAKMEGLEAVEDPSRPGLSKWDTSTGQPTPNPDGVKSIKDAFKSDPEEMSPDMAEEKPEEEAQEGEGEEDEEEKEDDEDEMDDEALKSQYAKMCAKMEKRGLMKKSEEKAEEVKKSEAPAAEDKTESLRKSVDERFDALTKAIAEISATVSKIASAPARKGVAGYQPLRKSEESEAQPLNKAEIIGKLLDLKKSGKYVDTALINRIETGRASEADAQSIKQLLG